MAMMELQLYKNKYNYPDFGSLSAYGNSKECTPLGLDLKGGTLKVAGNMKDFMNCNYLSLKRDGHTIYAWIENTKLVNDKWFEVAYRVDPLRTYRTNISLGTQMIDRKSMVSYKKDNLLGSSQAYPDVTSVFHPWQNTNARVFVVQVRPPAETPAHNTPVQPTPYQFFVCPYAANHWRDNTPLAQFFTYLAAMGETENIVTAYSIPYMDISGLNQKALKIKSPDDEATVEGFYILGNDEDPQKRLTRKKKLDFGTNLDNLMRVNHSVQVVIPDSGVINIPDEVLHKKDLSLRQDIDLFSGASNYMLEDDKGNFVQSVRGSSISSIPILSDPMDTYISQNQNALATSLIGDVASIAGGAAMAFGSGGVGAGMGGSAVLGGINGMINKAAGTMDAGNRYSNPPAFLGTALAGNFNNTFWVVVTQEHVDNADHVHGSFGYPHGRVGSLYFPGAGEFVKTEGCNVSSDGTVPRWAIEEINQLFNNGILAH